jgi:hypothetical protein
MPRVFPILGLLLLAFVTVDAAALGLAQAPPARDVAVHNAALADLSAARLDVHSVDTGPYLDLAIRMNATVEVTPQLSHMRRQLLGDVVHELLELTQLRGWTGATGRYKWSGLYSQLPGWHLPPWRNQMLLRRWEKARLSITVHIRAGYITSLIVRERSEVFTYAIRPL